VLHAPVGRRRFLALSAASAAWGLTRWGWAAPAAAPAGDQELNDYLVAEISQSALRANIDLIRRELKSSTKLCFVAKSNCYAHGWLPCKDAISPVADWVAVATPLEALAVRKSGWTKPVLLLMASGYPGETARQRLQELVANEITLTLAAPHDLPLIAAAAGAAGKPAQVHVKIDSGLSRSGVLPDRAPALVRQARHQAHVSLTGVYTHFGTADERDKTAAREQLTKFLAAIEACGSDAAGLIRHAAASAATIDLPESHLDMVRVGTAIYGYLPSEEMQRTLPLRGVFRLVSRLAQVKEVPAGAFVSYGRTFRFDRPTKIGLVPIGYSDGYWRSLSNRGVMRVAGRDVPVRGRVCMDQTIVELSGVPNAQVGDEVEIVSRDPQAPHSISRLAQAVASNIPEVLVRFGGPRIRRVATD